MARICQLYPNALPSMLVSRFFRVFANWRWPNPVMLCQIEDVPSLGHTVWDPRRYYKDRFQHMPIITPAYPAMNSSFNVSTSTLRVMTEEFQRGDEMCKVFSTWNHLLSLLNITERGQFLCILDNFIFFCEESPAKLST